jgi:hypothetical protein
MCFRISGEGACLIAFVLDPGNRLTILPRFSALIALFCVFIRFNPLNYLPSPCPPVQINDVSRSELEEKKGDGYVHLSDHHGFGTNSVFANKGDGQGTNAVKTKIPMGTNSVFVNKGDGQGTTVKDNARFEQLSQE